MSRARALRRRSSTTCSAVIRRLKQAGIASIVVEQNADIALSVADRVVVLSHGQVAWSGEAATSRRIQPSSASCSEACMMSDVPLLALEGVAKVYRRSLFDRTPAFRLRVGPLLRGPGNRRRDGAERRRQNDTVRDDRGLERADLGARRGGRPGHSARALSPARPAGDPLPSVLSGAAFQQDQAVLSAGARQRAPIRWSICSTNRSSIRRTAISASCWISSASCAARAAWSSFACTRPPRFSWKS